ncbi:MAG: hypothetical protein HYW49_05480 [Deltaproteobacteria bacterium]|nr:hypothetical protein [Deltaproteobacteria bacterium]
MRLHKSVILGVAMLSALAQAGEKTNGSGVRGGGQTIDIEARPRLRDLVDHTTCRWVNSKDFIERLRGTAPVLKALGETHWYLAHAITREAKSLKLCLTGTLKTIPVDDEDGLTVVRPSKNRQAAIRLNDLIFLDEALFKELPAHDRAMLLLHEVLHSFIPLETSRRNDKLRSIVNAISDNTSKRMSEEEFALQMTMNDLMLASTTAELDPIRARLETLVDPAAAKTARIAALQKIGMAALYDSGLWHRDVRDIEEFAAPIFQAARAAMENADYAALAGALKDGIEVDFPFFAIDEKSGLRLSLLDLSASAGDENMVRFLVDHAANGGGSTLDRLLKRVIVGELKTLEVPRLLAAGANPNSRSEFGAAGRMTLTTAALAYNRPEIFQALVQNPATTIDTLLESLGYAISTAPVNASLAFAKMLFATGKLSADIALLDGRAAVLAALTSSRLDVFRYLLSIGADPNRARDANSNGLLAIAVSTSPSAFVEALLKDSRTDLNAKNVDGLTAFDLAMDANNANAIALLIADSRFQMPDFGSPRYAAAEKLPWLLNHLALQDCVAGIQAVLKAHRFEWNELYFAAELARQAGKDSAYATIHAAMGQ